MGEDLGYDADLFQEYGDNLMLAEYYKLTKGRIGELRSWMDENWKIKKEDIEKSSIYETIVKLDFPLIYTTNYDHCLETAFEVFERKYNRIVEVNDLVNIESNVTQIVKFHGDTISDESIVLTESSYFQRLSFESPLDIKLRADMLGKTILFVGYSLSDINIRLLIYKLDQLWRNSNATRRPKSYLFLPTPNPIQKKIFESRGIETIVGEKLNEKESTEEFLQSLL